MLPATQLGVARGSAARLERYCKQRFSRDELHQVLLTSGWQTWTVQPCCASMSAAKAPTGPPPAMTAILPDMFETDPNL